MDEILALQQQLMAVQNTSTLYKLANRNVMEIVDLLIKKYGLELYFTSDGREFVTPECLDSMIKETVAENGRISLIELPNLLNIGAGVIESRAEDLVRKGHLANIGGTLISSTYMDNLAAEISDDLQVSNELKFADLSIKYELPTAYLTQELVARVGSQVNGQVSTDGKRLLTGSYMSLMRSRIKGVMKCQIMPKLISSLSKAYRMDGSAVEAELKLLIDGKELDGVVRSGFYIPNVFLEKKEQIVTKSLQDQGFVEYEWLEKNFLEKKPKDLLKKLGAGSLVFLDDMAITRKKIEDLREKVSSSLEADGFCETTEIFPSTFSDDDISKILLEEIGVEGLIVEGNTLILGSFLSKCVTKLKELIVKTIEDAEAQMEPSKGEKKKKGSKGAKDMPITKNDIMKYLEEKKVIEYIVDEDQREAFFKHLIPMVEKEYQSIKEELENLKNNASSDMMADLMTKVEHLGMTLLLANRSIKTLLEMNSSFDASLAETLALTILPAFIDRVIMLNFKRFKIHVDQSLLVQRKTDKHTLSSRVFADTVQYEAVIEKLPKDIREQLKEFLMTALDNNLPKLSEYLEAKSQEIGLPKLNVNKKSEKSLMLAQKYFIEGKLGSEENNSVKVGLFFSMVLMKLGVFLWPFFLNKPAQASIHTQWQALKLFKDSIEDKYWSELEAVHSIGAKEESSKSDAPEIKTLFKNLNKLI